MTQQMWVNWNRRMIKVGLVAFALVAGWYLFVYEKEYPHVKELKLAAGQKITLDDLGGKNWVFFCYGIEPGNTSGTRLTPRARVFAKYRNLKYDDAYYPYESSYSISAFLFVGPDGKSKAFWIDFERTEIDRRNIFPYEGCHRRGMLEFKLSGMTSGKVKIVRIRSENNGDNNGDN